MSRAVLVINNSADREKAAAWARSAPAGCRIEFKESKRSVPQNARFWAMLTEIASQKTHNGRKYPADTWRTIFMHALGREVQFIPSLDGTSFFPLGYRSSELSKAEMSELIEFMAAWGAENGVTFHDDAEAAAA